VLPSLSRLMKDGIGKESTREDHPSLASQLYYSYSESRKARSLAAIIGKDDLTERDRSFIAFGERFEKEFVAQAFNENRSIEDTLAKGWSLLTGIPANEMHRVTLKQMETYLPEKRDAG
jgi:V/A-type H+/Na+-transporting ATPase subunit B